MWALQQVYSQILRRQDPFRAWVEQGYVREVRHPRLPLTLYEYTAKTQHDGIWDPVVRIARGLVVEHVPGHPENLRRIVANPFPRFANLNEIEETQIGRLPKDLYIADKLDGSLIVVWHYDGRWHFSTRGSFASSQALAAQTWYEKHAAAEPADPSCTYLFEWISPDNRIVVDYGQRQELVLLAVRKNATGEEETPERLPVVAQAMGVPCVRIVPMGYSVRDITFGPPDEQEGYVLYSHRPYLRVKVKSPEYVRVHRLVTQARGARQVLEWICAGELPYLLAMLPPSLQGELQQTADALQRQYHRWMEAAHQLVEQTAHLPTRKEKALACQKAPRAVQAIFFALLDGKPEEASRRAWAAVARSLEEAGGDKP